MQQASAVGHTSAGPVLTTAAYMDRSEFYKGCTVLEMYKL